MATLKLKTKPAPRHPDRAPVRGHRTRPTLSQAQTERERRERDAFEPRGPRHESARGRRPDGGSHHEPAAGAGRRNHPPGGRRDEGPFTGRPSRPQAGPQGDRPAKPWADRPGERPPGRRDSRPERGEQRGDRPPRPLADRRPARPRDEAHPPRSMDEARARALRALGGAPDAPPAPRGAPRTGPGFRERPQRQPPRDAASDAPRGPREAGERARAARRERDPRHGMAEAFEPRSHRPSADRASHRDAPTAAPVHARRQPEGTGERLSKRLGEMGQASRREADDWIAAGWVRVNGRLAVLGQRVLPSDQIEIDPAARQQQARAVTVLLHKPIGYVSGQAEDGHEPAVLLVSPDRRWEDDPSKVTFHPGHLHHLAPAGRLDIDSTGLLVLTQDGRVAKALIGEDSLVEKEYLVRVAMADAPDSPGPDAPHTRDLLGADKLALLNHGLELDGQPLRPAKVSWQNEDQLRVVLREGKKRQIRRMCEAVGLKVLALKRVRIGRIPLGALPAGQWRYLAPWEKF